jgi:hypothetical protein
MSSNQKVSYFCILDQWYFEVLCIDLPHLYDEVESATFAALLQRKYVFELL